MTLCACWRTFLRRPLHRSWNGMPRSTFDNTLDSIDNNGEQSSIYYLDANNLYGRGAMHRIDALRISGCTRTTRNNGKDQPWSEWMGAITWSEWMGAITQDIPVNMGFFIEWWHRGTSGTPMNKFHWTCRYCGQSQRGENPPETHLRSCTSTQISRALLTVAIGSSTWVYHVTHIPPHHPFQTSTLHLWVRQYCSVGKKNHRRKEPVQIISKLHLWKIRGDWTEANEGEVC